MRRLQRGSCSWACSPLVVALAALALLTTTVRAATDDQNLTGLIYLADGTPLTATMWANNTSFAVYVNHNGNWSTAWRYPAAPTWYLTSGGAYSIVLPAAQQNVTWANGDPYRVTFDASAISGVPGTLDNAASHGSGDPGKISPFGATENAIVWNATNNWQRWDVVVLARPDLSIASSEVRVVPSTPAAGAVVAINATVRNLGARDGANVAVRFTDGAPPAGTRIGSDATISSLRVGGSATAETSWTAGPAGPHRLCAAADPDDRIPESNKTNNVGCVDVVVTGGPPTRPDYVATAPQPTPPIRTGLSRPLSFSVQVLNQGNGSAASAATLAFFNASSSASPFATFPVPPLAPSATSVRSTVTWLSPTSPGTYHVVADVDYHDDVAEWDETNNRFTWPVAVVTGPVTTLEIGAPNYTSTRTYVNSSTFLSFSALDQSGAGIRRTMGRVDSGTWTNYTATGPFRPAFQLSGEGPHFVEWSSEDFAGNVEATQSRLLVVDDTPPVTTILPAVGPFPSRTNFTLTATDAGSGVGRTEYRIDGGPWIAYAGAFAVPAGDHVIGYRSLDHMTNTERERTLVVSRVPAPPFANWKPLVAAVFGAVLALAGAWAARRRPWKGKTGRKATVTAFAITSLPFVLAETATGVASFLSGLLSIPPILGLGTAVDGAILAAGVTLAWVRARRNESTVTGKPQVDDRR